MNGERFHRAQLVTGAGLAIKVGKYLSMKEDNDSMNDLLTIIIAERRTLLRGLTISFLLVLPFTFLPIIQDGLTWEHIIQRFPLSTLYAFGFSFMVVVAAVIHNYNSLVDRKRYFDKPAFTQLGFYGRLDGLGSVVEELETFLLGKIGHYYFRLNIINPEQKEFCIEIVPLIDLEGNEELATILRKQYGFKQRTFFGQTIKATVKDLHCDNFLFHQLVQLEATLSRLGAQPLAIDEGMLDES